MGSGQPQACGHPAISERAFLALQSLRSSTIPNRTLARTPHGMPVHLALGEGQHLGPGKHRSASSPACRPAASQGSLHGRESTSSHLGHQQPPSAPLGLGWGSPVCMFPSITETVLNEGKEGIRMLSPFKPACTRDGRKSPIPPCVKSLALLFCLQRNKHKAFPRSSFSFWTVTVHLTPREHQEKNQPATEDCSSPTFFPPPATRFSPHAERRGRKHLPVSLCSWLRKPTNHPPGSNTWVSLTHPHCSANGKKKARSSRNSSQVPANSNGHVSHLHSSSLPRPGTQGGVSPSKAAARLHSSNPQLRLQNTSSAN